MLFTHRTSRAATWLAFGLWLCLALACCSPVVLAGSGDVQTLPLNPRLKLKSKLRLIVDTRWVDGTGYRPVVLEAVPSAGPSPVDRQIRVTLRPMGMGNRETSTLIDIPQGSRNAKKVLLLPQDELWHNVYVNVTEGGAPIEELSAQYVNLSRTNYWNWTEASPAVLFIDSDVPPRPLRDAQVAKFRATALDPNPTHDLPDYRNFVRTFPESNYASMMVATNGSQKIGDIDLLSQMNDVARADLLPPAELPENWLALTSFDMVFISLADLDKTAKEQPKRFEALREWLNAGSVLCVYDVGKEFERLAELEKRLKLAPLPQPDKPTDPYRGWQVPDLRKQFAGLPQTMYDSQEYVSDQARIQQALADVTAELVEKAKKTDPKSVSVSWPFVAREAGLGYVVALREENPFPGDSQSWGWLLHTIPNNHWMWFRRHGMSMHRTNDDFWNFLIPGVGVAPVVSFLLLITLFAAVIGPVNYVVLSRWRRLYLLLITVPVGATIVTVSLFLYAIATDGVGVRSRIRSFTELDPATGHAVSWSRQSYYASIAPSQGLMFGDDTAVYPLIHEPTTNGGRRSTNHKLEWDAGQHLRSGYLPSRSATQFLVIHAAPSEAKLQVQPQAAGKPPRITNGLGVAIDYLAVADARTLADKAPAGKEESKADDEAGVEPYLTPQTYWQIESLAAGESAEATPVSASEVQRRLNKVYRDNAPAYPENYDPTLHNNAMEYFFGGYSRYVNVDAGQSSPAMPTSVLERQLSRLGRNKGVILEPGTFLAITDSPPQVPLGVEQMRQDRSLHVVHGRWGKR